MIARTEENGEESLIPTKRTSNVVVAHKDQVYYYIELKNIDIRSIRVVHKFTHIRANKMGISNSLPGNF